MDKVAKKINIITLGCSKNLVDSEQFAAQALSNGYEVVHNSNVFDFDIAVVNTCGFINDAKEESIETILELVGAKEESKIEKIIVFGCLTERYYDDLKAELPEVDVIIGNYNIDDLIAAIDSDFIEDKKYERVPDSHGHYAFLKIAEGCNRKCSFCAIPLFKGKYVSRSQDDIIAEANELARKGVKELILIAQDLSYYGYDFDKEFKLPELVEDLTKIDGIEWIRLHYLYPFLFPERLLDVIADNPKVCNYVDIPLQHISDNVLKAMNRGGTKEQTVELLNEMRRKIPNAVIRTTMLVGHPQETEDDFNELIEFVKEQKFDRLGVFTYSEEEGTSAAAKFTDDIPQEVKFEREEIIMEVQRDISRELNSKKLGNIYKVIIDRMEDTYYVARTEFDSVEVDNEVIIETDETLEIGSFYDVRITGFEDFELYGEKI